jgi:hypothetical protein
MQIKVARTVDDPLVSEIFVDSPGVGGWSADGVIHVDLFTLRREPPTPEGESAYAQLRARLALTIPAAVALQETLAHHLAVLEKAGFLKRGAPQTSEAKH